MPHFAGCTPIKSKSYLRSCERHSFEGIQVNARAINKWHEKEKVIHTSRRYIWLNRLIAGGREGINGERKHEQMATVMILSAKMRGRKRYWVSVKILVWTHITCCTILWNLITTSIKIICEGDINYENVLHKSLIANSSRSWLAVTIKAPHKNLCYHQNSTCVFYTEWNLKRFIVNFIMKTEIFKTHILTSSWNRPYFFRLYFNISLFFV